ncbi:hypothetical protein, partial [Kitasatospora sp. NPDC007106]|uniref:hypothetical protein n=1 Tax=Kitasatospora sp. NPDC007106 TaxID=3156914 RepID=UPI0033CD2167
MIGSLGRNDWSLAWGFLEAGRVLVEHWKRERNHDSLALPALYNLRHGIELALKEAIRDAAECARRDGVIDAAWSEKLNDYLGKTHDIGSLAGKLDRCLALLVRFGGGMSLGEDIRRGLARLHALDTTGQAFRYTTVKKGNVLVMAQSDGKRVKLEDMMLTAYEAGDAILMPICGMLSAYAEHQEEAPESCILPQPQRVVRWRGPGRRCGAAGSRRWPAGPRGPAGGGSCRRPSVPGGSGSVPAGAGPPRAGPPGRCRPPAAA